MFTPSSDALHCTSFYMRWGEKASLKLLLSHGPLKDSWWCIVYPFRAVGMTHLWRSLHNSALLISKLNMKTWLLTVGSGKNLSKMKSTTHRPVHVRIDLYYLFWHIVGLLNCPNKSTNELPANNCGTLLSLKGASDRFRHPNRLGLPCWIQEPCSPEDQNSMSPVFGFEKWYLKCRDCLI